MDINNALPIINAIGVIVFLVTTIYYQRKSGAAQGASETVEILSTQVKTLRDAYKEIQSKATDQQSQIDKLNGQLKEKDARITDLLSIFQGRDPDTQKLHAEAYEAMKKGDETLRLVQANADAIREVNTNVEKLYKAIERHLKAIEENGKH